MVVNSTTTEKTLLDKIREKQKAEKLSDYGFTAKLGIERSIWTHTRLGRRRIGFTLLKAIIRTYPELNADVLDFLREEDHDKESEQ